MNIFSWNIKDIIKISNLSVIKYNIKLSINDEMNKLNIIILFKNI